MNRPKQAVWRALALGVSVALVSCIQARAADTDIESEVHRTGIADANAITYYLGEHTERSGNTVSTRLITFYSPQATKVSGVQSRLLIVSFDCLARAYDVTTRVDTDPSQKKNQIPVVNQWNPVSADKEMAGLWGVFCGPSFRPHDPSTFLPRAVQDTQKDLLAAFSNAGTPPANTPPQVSQTQPRAPDDPLGQLTPGIYLCTDQPGLRTVTVFYSDGIIVSQDYASEKDGDPLALRSMDLFKYKLVGRRIYLRFASRWSREQQAWYRHTEMLSGVFRPLDKQNFDFYIDHLNGRDLGQDGAFNWSMDFLACAFKFPESDAKAQELRNKIAPNVIREALQASVGN